MVSKLILLSAAFGASAYAATAPLYGQCGGKGWTGATSCASGSTCVAQNAYYSQCVVSSSGATSTKATTTAKATSTKAATTSAKAATTSTKAATTSTKATSSAKASTSAVSGTSYKASFTEYGSTDDNGSGNCNVATTACGFYTYPGYSAAVSQNEFGVGPGAGAGPACGTCWKLTAETDSSGDTLSNAGNAIVVQVTNLCPATGNPLCAQNGLTGTNQYGANLNFDLCIDSGASAALFGSTGVGLAVGTAVQVSCSSWTGTVVG